MLENIRKYIYNLMYPSVVDLPTTEESNLRDSQYNNPYREDYTKLWSEMVLIRDITPYIEKILDNRELYKKAAEYCWLRYDKGHFNVPWQVIAILHLMEAGCNPMRQILNGEYWSRETKYVPKGMGPWCSFERSCLSSFTIDKKVPPVWDIPNTLYYFEAHNGFGYRRYRNINSPYLWSFTNHYVNGKYISDGRYDEDAISKQPGVAAILKFLQFTEPT